MNTPTLTYHVENWRGNTILTTTDLDTAKKAAEEYAFESASDVEVIAYENNDPNGEEVYFWETHLTYTES